MFIIILYWNNIGIIVIGNIMFHTHAISLKITYFITRKLRTFEMS